MERFVRSPDARVAAVVDSAPAQDGVLWTAADVARYLKVSRSWVYHRAEAGLLPYLRVGGLIRFDSDAIRKYARDGASDIQRPRALPRRVRALGTGK
jgi:excisionase family DNA binding protein